MKFTEEYVMFTEKTCSDKKKMFPNDLTILRA